MGKGTFYGPFGIHSCFAKKWNIDLSDLNTNCMVGCRALSGINNLQSLKRRLRTYNATFNHNYWNAVLSLIKKYEKKYNF
jgi:hypothetical protein